MAGATSHGDDPFASFLKPPANESSTERAARKFREAKAKKRSEAIDLELRKDREMLVRTRENLLKVVLIGDSESGASCSSDSIYRKRAIPLGQGDQT